MELDTKAMKKIATVAQIATMVIGLTWTLLACQDTVNSETAGFGLMLAFGGFIWMRDNYEQNKN